MANEKAKEMGLKIKNARSNAHVTQAELAHRLGVTAQSISQYERGVKIPKVETLEKIANALGIKISCFYNLEPQNKQMFPVWRNPETDPPKVETEVLVLYRRYDYLGITTAQYEDGNVFAQDSEWNWEDLPNWETYDEERDDYRIPEGWWEYRHFNPDEVYNNKIDCPVVGWMPLPPKKIVEGK